MRINYGSKRFWLLREKYYNQSRQQIISFQHGDVQPLQATISVGFVRQRPPSPYLARGGSLGNVTATSMLAFHG